MKRRYITWLALSLVCIAGIVDAADFAARAAAGKKNLASPEGQRYEQSWGEVMGNVLHTCIPIGSTNPANLGKFTFVADVSAAGEVSSVDVEPRTAVSRCFAEQFGRSRLTRPPFPLKDGALLSIADDIEVGP
jgi:hypothetical protein